MAALVLLTGKKSDESMCICVHLHVYNNIIYIIYKHAGYRKLTVGMHTTLLYSASHIQLHKALTLERLLQTRKSGSDGMGPCEHCGDQVRKLNVSARHHIAWRLGTLKSSMT